MPPPRAARTRIQVLRHCAHRGVCVGALALLLGTTASAVQTPQATPAPPADNQTFTLTPHFVKGQTYRYQSQVQMTLKFAAKDATKDIYVRRGDVLRYKVQDVKSNGSVVFSVISEGGSMVNGEGATELLPKEPDNYPRSATFDKQEKLIALKDPSQSAQDAGPLGGLFDLTDLLVQIHFLPLPNRPVRIGDSWSVRYPLPNVRSDGKDRPNQGSEPSDTNDSTAIQATLTLLGTEKIGDQETLRIKEIISIPYESQVDAQGKPVSHSDRAAGHIIARETLTQMVNALPADGQMVRSQGEISGTVKFEGAIAQLVPSATMNIGGTLAAARMPDATPAGNGQEKPAASH